MESEWYRSQFHSITGHYNNIHCYRYYSCRLHWNQYCYSDGKSVAYSDRKCISNRCLFRSKLDHCSQRS